MRYWDSSAIVPLLVEQQFTQRVTAIYREDPVVVTWWGSRVECDSSLARLERDGRLSIEDTAESFRRLDSIAASWQEIEPMEILRDTGRRLLRTHPLRAADALQLAAAILASEGRPATLEIICLDARLSTAARREGFPVLGDRPAKTRR